MGQTKKHQENLKWWRSDQNLEREEFHQPHRPWRLVVTARSTFKSALQSPSPAPLVLPHRLLLSESFQSRMT